MLSIVLHCKIFLCPFVITRQYFLLCPFLDWTTVISKLHRICKRYIQYFENLNSCTTIFGQNLIYVSTVHLAWREVTPIISEALTLHWKYFGIHLCFSLLLYFPKTIAINKRPLIRMRMRMQIHKEDYSLWIITYNSLHSKHCRLFMWLGTIIKSIQIMARSIHPIGPMKHAIRIHYRYNNKYKDFPKCFCPRIWWNEKIYDSFKRVWRWGLPWMNTTCEKYIRLIEFLGSTLYLIVRKDRSTYSRLFLLLYTVIRGQCYQIYCSPLEALY